MNIRSCPALIILIIAATYLMIGCSDIPTRILTSVSVDKVAVATITEIDQSGLSGTAIFTEADGGIHVIIEIQNATPGLHAMHLHTGSSCTDAGPHWHPIGTPAGTPGIPVVQATLDVPPIGIGEVGNIVVDEDGTGTIEFTTPLWSLGGDPNIDILGKLIMIHETGDTFLTNPHAHQMDMDTNMETDVDTIEPHFHPPETPPHSHTNTSAVVPPILPGGGAKIGCGLIVLIE